MRPISVSLRILTCFLALLAATLWSGGNGAQAQKRTENRVALVIGDSNYKRVSPLPNPVHDSEDVAAALTRLNFEVKSVQDADFATFNRELRDFGRLATGADIAVIYFAGHGIEVDGENWLLPTDVELHSDVDAANEAISLKSAIVAVGSAHTLGLVILDACRNNPFESIMQRPAATRGLTRGLARVDPFENVLVVYAARDGTVANDGNGRNSPFTNALLRHLETPGLEIDFLFRNVRDDVRAATHNEQQPFVYGSLSSEEIYLNPPVVSAAETAKPEDASEIAWAFLKGTGDIATLTRFTDRFPTSSHVAEAKVRVVSLQGLPVATSGDPGAVYKLTSYVQASDSGFEDAEIAVAKHFRRDNPAIEEAWNFVKDTTDHTLIRRFTEQFPTKKRRVVAESRIAALGQAPLAPRPVLRRPLLTVDSDIYASAARDLSVMECYLLGNQNDPSCRLAVERYPEIARFPENLEFLQNFCGSIGKGSDCLTTVKSNWNFPNTNNPLAANNSLVAGSSVTPPAGGAASATPTGPAPVAANLSTSGGSGGLGTASGGGGGEVTTLSNSPTDNNTATSTSTSTSTTTSPKTMEFKMSGGSEFKQLISGGSRIALAIINSAVFSPPSSGHPFSENLSSSSSSIANSSSGNPPSSSSPGGNPASNPSSGMGLSDPGKSLPRTDYAHRKNSSTTSGSKTGKVTHINLKTDAHLARGAHAPSSPQTSATASTKLTTTTANTTADIKTPHTTADVKVPKIVQNTPTQSRVPEVKVDVKVPKVEVKVPKVEVKVPNIQIHLPH
jgi:Caspase domain